MNKPEVLELRIATLGEGPHWHEKDQCLFYVDIDNTKVYRYDAKTGENRAVSIKDAKYVSFVIPVKGSADQFLIGVDRKVCALTWDGSNGGAYQLKTCFEVETELATNRFNDAKCDTSGRLYAGTMARNNISKPGVLERYHSAGLYRVDGKGCSKAVDKVSLSNGLDWTPDGQTMYYIDSIEAKVVAFDVSRDDGGLSNRRVVFDIKASGIEGVLDGMAIDTRGHLWIALFGGSKVIEVDPAKSEVLGSIDFDEARCLTSVAFGGEKLNDLYVTSAKGGDPNKLRKEAGSLFVVRNLKSFQDGQPVTGYAGRSANPDILTALTASRDDSNE